MSLSRTITLTALMLALLPAAAYSQEQQRPTARTDQQKKEDADIEKAYERVMKGVNAQTAPSKYDPWQTVRPAPAGKSANR